MMSEESFREYVRCMVYHYLPEERQKDRVLIRKVRKTTESYYGLTVLPEKEEGVYASVNLDDCYRMYCEGMDMEELMQEIGKTLCMKPVMNEVSFLDYSDVKNRLFVRVSGVERCRSLLRDIPHRRIEDLVMSVHILVSNTEEGMSNAMVTRTLLGRYGISEEQLFKDALKNSAAILPFRMRSAGEIIEEYGAKPSGPAGSMFCVTNDTGLNGASALFYEDAMEYAACMLRGSYFILPSSIHELLLIPKSFMHDPEHTRRMIGLMNRTTVADRDVLSDSLYYYDASKKRFAVYRD